MAGKTILTTERLHLREFDEDDLDAFLSLLSDPEVLRYTGDPGGGLKSKAEARAILHSHPLQDYRKYGYGRWACALRASGAVIGFAGLKYLEATQEVDIGYRFLPAYWGQGLASEACQAVFDYGRRELAVGRITALVDPANVASVKILEKLGLVQVGRSEYAGRWFLKYATRGPATEQGEWADP